jgi:hypothetical protein
MAGRASVADFITQISAKPGYSVSVNQDGSVAISKNGVVRYVSVFWNITLLLMKGYPGPANGDGVTYSAGLTELSYSSGQTSYPVDSVTILPDGASGSGAPSMDAQAFLDGLN